jgi:hypothetical protein
MIYKECLVYQVVAQKERAENMAGHVVSTFTDTTDLRWTDTLGYDWCARAMSWLDVNSVWVICFQCRMSSPPPQSPIADAAEFTQLVYSRDRRAWLVGTSEVVPRRIARKLSKAIGFETTDGFKSLRPVGVVLPN